MTKEEIRALLNDTESDRIERTISTTNTDKFGQAICAFANDLPDYRLPGYLFWGVKDDGEDSRRTSCGVSRRQPSCPPMSRDRRYGRSASL